MLEFLGDEVVVGRRMGRKDPDDRHHGLVTIDGRGPPPLAYLDPAGTPAPPA